jgi:hypothetical protein
MQDTYILSSFKLKSIIFVCGEIPYKSMAVKNRGRGVAEPGVKTTSAQDQPTRFLCKNS